MRLNQLTWQPSQNLDQWLPWRPLKKQMSGIMNWGIPVLQGFWYLLRVTEPEGLNKTLLCQLLQFKLCSNEGEPGAVGRTWPQASLQLWSDPLLLLTYCVTLS